jgi:hypothetical protein
LAGAGDADLAATARNGPLRELLTSAASVRGPAAGRVRRTIAGASRVAEGLWIHREARDAAVESSTTSCWPAARGRGTKCSDRSRPTSPVAGRRPRQVRPYRRDAIHRSVRRGQVSAGAPAPSVTSPPRRPRCQVGRERFARPSAWGTLKQRCASSVTDGVAPDPGGPTPTGSWRWPRTTAATSNRKTSSSSSFSRRRSGTISEGHLHSSLSRCRAQRTHPASLAMRCDVGLPPGHARRVWPPTCCWYSPSSSPTLSPTRLQLLRSGPRSITTEFASRCAIARSGHHASAPAVMLPAASGSSSSPPSPTNGAGRPQLPARLCGPNITTSKENQRGAVAIEAAMVPQPTRVSRPRSGKEARRREPEAGGRGPD